MERLNSGEKKEYLRTKFEHSQHWSDDMWKSKMGGSGGNKKNTSIVLIHEDKKCFISELFKVIQDTHRMRNQFTLRREFRIDFGRTKFEPETDGILHVCGSFEQGTLRST